MNLFPKYPVIYKINTWVWLKELGWKYGHPVTLAIARARLRERGLRLILDFVPNHVAPDHPWTLEHPEYFIRGNPENIQMDTSSYFEVRGNIFARARDPYFPAWPDVLQVNAFNPDLRQASTDTVLEIARHCDGIRCDMAMLMMNSVFQHTW